MTDFPEDNTTLVKSQNFHQSKVSSPISSRADFNNFWAETHYESQEKTTKETSKSWVDRVTEEKGKGNSGIER